MYWDAKNLYRWARSQKLPVDNSERENNASNFGKSVTKKYNEKSDKRYIFEVYVERMSKQLHDRVKGLSRATHSDLSVLKERMKLKKSNKVECNFYENKKQVVHIRSLNQELNHGLLFEKMHRLIKFNQKVQSKIHMCTKLSTEAKNGLEEDFFKLMNDSVF